MVAIWTDPDAPRSDGPCRENSAEERFDVRRMVTEYEALYRETIGDDRRTNTSCMDGAGTMPEPVELSTAVE